MIIMQRLLGFGPVGASVLLGPDRWGWAAVGLALLDPRFLDMPRQMSSLSPSVPPQIVLWRVRNYSVKCSARKRLVVVTDNFHKKDQRWFVKKN